jgi:hypothetical protein
MPVRAALLPTGSPARRLALGVALLACAAAAFAAGCGAGAKGSSPVSGTQQAAGAHSGAAVFRAQLTGLLAEHVQASGMAAAVALRRGFASPGHAAAAAALDANARALGAAIGAAYGAEAQARFTATWRKGARLVTAYARGQATEDEKVTARALDGLDRWRADVGAVLATANPRLAAEAVARALAPPVAGLASAVNDDVERDPRGPEQLRRAVEQTVPLARLIADATASRLPRAYPGAPDAGAAELRAVLTGLLVGHGELVGRAVAEELWNGRDAGTTRAAAAALDASAVSLSQVVASAYGQKPGTAFLSLWRNQDAFLLDYAHAEEHHDAGRAGRALADLDATRHDLGTFFAGFGPELGRQAVEGALAPPVAATAAAIRAFAAGSPKAYARLHAAAKLAPHLAGVLAAGIAARYPARFPAR